MFIFGWKHGSVQLQEPDLDIAISGGGEEEIEILAIVDALARRKRLVCHAKNVVVDETRFDVSSVTWFGVDGFGVSYTDVKLDLSPHTHGRRVE